MKVLFLKLTVGKICYREYRIPEGCYQVDLEALKEKFDLADLVEIEIGLNSKIP